MKRLLILCSLIFALALAGQGQVTPDQTAAVVRILALGKPDDKGMIYGSTGTGFVISNDGLIMTNNHVIASEPLVADHPYSYIVLRKVGGRIFAYRATFVAQDPDVDLAVIRCPELKATPFQFLTAPLKEFQDVYSLGFPAVSDLGLFKDQSGKEDENAYIRIALIVDQKLTEKGVKSLDITDIFQDSKASANGEFTSQLLQDFVTPTCPSGKVEKLRNAQWGSKVVPFIQHSCDIRGGNSGGPLINGGGQVVGVVGDGYKLGQESGPHAGEATKLAVQTIQVEKFLQTSGITGCDITDKAWTPPIISKVNIVPIIIAAALAVVVALAAFLITLFKARRKTGMTDLLESLKSKGVTSGTKLLSYIGGRPGHESSLSRPPNGLAPGGNGWKLDVRTSAGKTFRIPISEGMFTNNGSRLVLGRSGELCDLVVEDETVSRQHADIRKNGKGFEVADRNSSNGTAVNGVFIRKPFELIPLKPGDTLTVGNVKLDFNRN
jgi:S1-C subfamily serine protease